MKAAKRGQPQCPATGFDAPRGEQAGFHGKPSTRSSDRSVINTHILPAFGDLHLHDITPEAVQTFYAKLKETISPKSKEPYEEKTAWNIISTMRSIWNSALDWGYVQEKIFDHVRLKTRSTREGRCFSPAECVRILEAAPEPYCTFYWLAGEAGPRAGELCELRWPDFDFNGETGSILVKRSVWRGHVTEPKTKKGRRPIALSKALTTRLRAMCEAALDKTGLVFHTRNNTPWDPNLVVKRKLHPLLKSLGIPKGGLHAFRHFMGSTGSSIVGTSPALRDRLGHSSLAVTDKYAHRISEDDRLIAEGIAKVLRGRLAI